MQTTKQYFTFGYIFSQLVNSFRIGLNVLYYTHFHMFAFEWSSLRCFNCQKKQNYTNLLRITAYRYTAFCNKQWVYSFLLNSTCLEDDKTRWPQDGLRGWNKHQQLNSPYRQLLYTKQCSNGKAHWAGIVLPWHKACLRRCPVSELLWRCTVTVPVGSGDNLDSFIGSKSHQKQIVSKAQNKLPINPDMITLVARLLR